MQHVHAIRIAHKIDRTQGFALACLRWIVSIMRSLRELIDCLVTRNSFAISKHVNAHLTTIS